MFLRFLFTALVVYLGYRFLRGIWEKESRKEEIKGKSKSRPLNLKNEDVEDADFEDIEDKER
jgi:hypothetical protein